MEIHIRHGETGSFRLSRLPANEVRRHVRSRGAFLAPIQLTRRFAVEGILMPDLGTADRRPLREMITRKHVTTVHSEKRDGKPAISGMWIAGEVIAAQKLLTQMGAASADSLLLCHREDQAVGPTPGTLGVSCFPGFYGRGVLCVPWSLFPFGVW